MAGEPRKGVPSLVGGPPCGKHVARFILVGLYSGTRSAAICGASFHPAIGRGHVDVERGVFVRRARGTNRETNKRQTTAPIPTVCWPICDAGSDSGSGRTRSSNGTAIPLRR